MLNGTYKEHEIQFSLEWEFTSTEQVKINVSAYEDCKEIICDFEEGTFGFCHKATEVSIYAMFTDEINDALSELDLYEKDYKGVPENCPESDISDYEYYKSKF